MKMKRQYFLGIVWLLGLVVFLGAPMVAAGHRHKIKVGVWGRLTFKNETRVGNLTLPPGRYLFEHINKGGDHYGRFSRITWNHVTHYSVMGEVKCKLEALPVKVKRTTVQFVHKKDFDRITRIEVRGENVAHLFAGPIVKH